MRSGLRLLPALVVVLAACTTTTDPSVAPTGTTTAAGSPTATGVPTTTQLPPTTTSVGATTTTVAPLLGLAWEEVARVDGFVTGMDPVADGLLVAVKDGRVLLVSDGAVHELGDISDRVDDGGERGLLDIELHPDDGRMFLHHSGRDGATVLLEATIDPTPDGRMTPGADLLRIDQPAGNHNGGSLEFGPDGMLYLALGDGGGSGDRYGHGQRTDTLLAAILRLDVDTPGEVYAPADNPFADGAAPEVWAWGLRNPWRITFDEPSASLVVADVGQDRYEEVTVIPADVAGANHGWPVMEGFECFEPRSGCDRDGLVTPTVVVEHGDDGTCSITGGVVYRGAAIPELVGHYFFSDYCGGWLRSFAVDAAEGVEPDRWDVDRLDGPAVFGADRDGEILVSGADGRIQRLVPLR